MGRSTKRASAAVAEAIAEGPDAMGTLRLLVIVPEDERKWSSFAVGLWWGGELRSSQWIHGGHGKTTVQRWLSDRVRERSQAWPVPVGQVRTLVEAALARGPSPVASALLGLLAREPPQPVASPAPSDAGLHPNEARVALSEWPFLGRLVLSQGDLVALGISLPTAPLDARAFEAWAREASSRLDVPALRERLERIARVGAFMLHLRGNTRMAGQLAVWAEAVQHGTREHPLALALLRNTVQLEPERVHEPSMRLAERARLVQRVTGGYTVGNLLRVELGARLFAGVVAALEDELLSERMPRYDALQSIAGALVDQALRVGPRAAASAAAIGPLLSGLADADVAKRMAAVSCEGLLRFADEVERAPAMAWAARDPSETLPRDWFTHGLPADQP